MREQERPEIEFSDVWEWHDRLRELTPSRSQYWGLYKTKEEAEEWCVTDADINEDQFLAEGADVMIAWMTVMKSCGYSYEVAMQAVIDKLDVVIHRAERTNILVVENGQSWDKNYQRIKGLDREY